jgi:hypothetical protein
MDPYAEHVQNLLKHLAITQCGHCSNKSNMEVVASYDATRSFTGPFGDTYNAGYVWELLLCPVCSGVNLRQVDVHWGAEPEIGKRAARVVYPSTGKSLAGLPLAIDSAYQAALKVRHVDANAFAVLLRRVIEGVCLDRGASDRNLYEQLNDLAEKDEIPIQLAEMAHQLRLFGNIGAHFGEGALTSAEAALLDDLCGAILEYVYVAPGWLDKLKSKLEELKTEKDD